MFYDLYGIVHMRNGFLMPNNVAYIKYISICSKQYLKSTKISFNHISNYLHKLNDIFRKLTFSCCHVIDFKARYMFIPKYWTLH